MLPPLRHILDPRERAEADRRPIVDSVNIPLSELKDRMGELPPRETPLSVAAEGPLLKDSLNFLAEGGRQAVAVEPIYGQREPGRLWKPNDFLMEQISGMVPGLAYDLGCGSGRDAVALAANGWKVVAIDRHQFALEEGARMANHHLPGSLSENVSWERGDIGSFVPKHESLLVAFRSLEGLHLRRVGETAPLGSMLLFEGFTEVNRITHGRPDPNHAFNEEFVRDCLRDWQIHCLHAGWRDNEMRQHTIRLVARRVDAPFSG